MSEVIRPDNEDQLLEVLAEALASEAPLEVIGHGSRRALGRPVEASRILDMSAFAGVEMYEPHELVMTAGAGTPLADIQAMLAENRQQFMFEAPDYGPLLGGGPGQGTIGGLFATNLSGPRRLASGAARDHILGFHACSGRAECFKSGGRVVKNVTGFDLSKLMTGSFGTLAVMTQVTFKVMPLPEETRTVVVSGLDDGTAVAAMTAALQSSHEVSAAAHLPRAAAGEAPVRLGAGAMTAVRVEGPEPSVVHRAQALQRLLGSHGETTVLESEDSAALWRAVRDVAPLVGEAPVVWRLSVPPALGAQVVNDIASRLPFTHFYDRGGGMAWLATQEGEDGAAADIRAAVDRVGGTATLIRAPEAMRAQVPVFHPQPEPVFQLARRVKEAFDPRRILNRGRMYPGL